MAKKSTSKVTSAQAGGGHQRLRGAPVNTLHVYDWLELPPADENERLAKEWLGKYLRPAYDKHKEGLNTWLESYRLTVEWKGKRYICSGASRMGDVWLKAEGSANYYDHCVDVEELSNWRRISTQR